ncbi:MAG: hypothetical protein HY562_05960 [Ignavibacteriales bacterium]|nr:hypothetical protein [Ignavibacteriales bacterium]
MIRYEEFDTHHSKRISNIEQGIIDLGNFVLSSLVSDNIKKPLWRCPKCGAKFVTSNIWHSCGKHTLKELFAKSDPHVLRLFRTFEKLVRACGRVTMIPRKSSVVFMVRVRFAGAYPRKSYLLCGLGLPRKVRHPKLVKYQAYASHFQGHLFRIDSEKDFDGHFVSLLRESYGVGTQKYLKNKRD